MNMPFQGSLDRTLNSDPNWSIRIQTPLNEANIPTQTHHPLSARWAPLKLATLLSRRSQHPGALSDAALISSTGNPGTQLPGTQLPGLLVELLRNYVRMTSATLSLAVALCIHCNFSPINVVQRGSAKSPPQPYHADAAHRGSNVCDRACEHDSQI